MRRSLVFALAAFVPFAFASALGACNHTPAEPASTPRVDAGTTRPVTDASVACFTHPTTYLEIINACTDAQAIDKTVDLSPMNQPDGGLQPLP